MRIFTAALIVLVASLTACKGPGSSDSKVQPYPLETCIVTDNKLGSMGDPITRIYDDREIKFCCRPCIKEFEENPQEFLSKLER